MSESTNNVICDYGSSTQANLNASNEVPLDIDRRTSDTDQNMEMSDDESTVTISENSADEYFDVITFGGNVVYDELYSADQNKQNESSNNVNVVNNEENDDNDDSDYNEEDFLGNVLIANDIYSAEPNIAEIHRHNSGYTHDHTHHQTRGQDECLRVNRVCHRQECNNLAKRCVKPRAAAIKAAAKIAKSGTKRKNRNNKGVGTIAYFSCGHREQIGTISLKLIGINTPTIFKESFLMDARLMKTSLYLLKLPAALTISQILSDHQRKANLCEPIMGLIYSAFNYALSELCLYYIEKRQYDEIIKNYPDRQVFELYGLAHLLRFIGCLPRLYDQMKPHRYEFSLHVTAFMNGLMNYLVAENLHVDFEKDYVHVMPEYHKLTYQT